MPIKIVKHNENKKYVIKPIRKIFNLADHLLTPAFIMLFAMIAVKLVQTPNLFVERDQEESL